jgi:hypothetical protein
MNQANAAPAQVVAVLLADGWHRVIPGSFSVGPLAFGSASDLGVPGYRFDEADTATPYRPATLAGPVSSILAVRQVNSAPRPVSGLGRPALRHLTHPIPEAAG